jgi:hypothetical protein
MTTEATLTCPNGCFTVEYSGGIDSDDVDDRNFLNRLGVPTKVARGDGTCPNCNSDVSVDWGGDDE